MVLHEPLEQVVIEVVSVVEPSGFVFFVVVPSVSFAFEATQVLTPFTYPENSPFLQGASSSGFGSSGIGSSGVTVSESELQDCPLYLPSPEVLQESSKGF